MCVKKIIQAYPKTFNIDKNANYSEIDAIRLVASMECEGNNIQKEQFEIRQSYVAIHNLMSLGFTETAIDLAESLMPRAEVAQLFKVAEDLCEILISHYYHVQNLSELSQLKTIRNKFNMILSYEYDFKILFGEAMCNFQSKLPANNKEVINLVNVIEKKLSVDILWYHFSYFQCKGLLENGEGLEILMVEAIDYFENLHFNHSSSIRFFVHNLIKYYIKNDQYFKVTPLIEKQLGLFSEGSQDWFEEAYLFTALLLKYDDIGANDVCIMAMNKSEFVNLPEKIKNEWKSIYKETVRQLLKH